MVNCKWCALHLQTTKTGWAFFYAEGDERSEFWIKVMGAGMGTKPKHFPGRDRAESIEKCQQLKAGINYVVWFVLLFTYSWISSRFKSNWNILHCNPVLQSKYKYKSGSATQVTWALSPVPKRKSGLCSLLMLRHKPLDELAGSVFSRQYRRQRQWSVTSRCQGPGSGCREGCLFRLTTGTLDDPLR